MSADDIPYQLRPNKFIDRQLFIDLLGRLIPSVGNEKYVYISMGGKHLVDHRAVYRQLGIRHLFSFDKEASIVARQDFNKPIGQAICREMISGALISEIDTILGEFPNASNIVVWLDYTDPHARLTQLQEFTEVLQRLQPDDVLRITLNANVATLTKNHNEWRAEGAVGPKEFRLEKLREDLGDLVPTDLEPIGETNFAEALVRCVELAASRAERNSDGLAFEPLLVTSYRDGQRMVTVTVRARNAKDIRQKSVALKSWPFRASGWTSIENIVAPDLSLRERQKIDSHLNRTPRYILDRLKFELASSATSSLDVIRSYKRFHRYYPDFRNIEF